MFLMPGMVITLHTTGALHTVLSPAHIAEMIRYLANHQNSDGGYGLHIEGHSTMFGTVLRWVHVARRSQAVCGSATSPQQDRPAARPFAEVHHSGAWRAYTAMLL